MQVYASTVQATLKIRRMQLTYFFEQVKNSDIIVLMGDFNAKNGDSKVNYDWTHYCVNTDWIQTVMIMYIITILYESL